MKETALLTAYRWFFVAFISFSSAQTVLSAHHGGGHSATHLIILGSVEIVGALLFLFRLTQLIGAGLLIGVFAIAFYVSIMAGEMPARFVFYAGTTAFILLSGRRG